MMHTQTAQWPWKFEHLIPAGSTCPEFDRTVAQNRPASASSWNVNNRIIPAGSTCPAPASADGAASTFHHETLRPRLVPAGSACPAATEIAAANHVALPDQTLNRRIVPSGSTCQIVASATATHSPAETLIEHAFLSDDRIPGLSHSTTAAWSIVMHAVLLGAALLVPLWFTESLNTHALNVTMLAPPPQMSSGMTLRATPTAKTQPVAAAPSKRVFMAHGVLIAPLAMPKHAAVINEAPLPEDAAIGIPGGVYGGLPSDIAGLGLTEAAAPPPPIPAAATASASPVVEQPKEPLHVGGNVRAPHLVSQVEPVYPKLARLAKIEGDVVIAAIINTKGAIEQMKVISGPPLLYQAALDAVRQWKYEPTYLNGVPWPLQNEITVHFRLGAYRGGVS